MMLTDDEALKLLRTLGDIQVEYDTMGGASVDAFCHFCGNGFRISRCGIDWEFHKSDCRLYTLMQLKEEKR